MEGEAGRAARWDLLSVVFKSMLEKKRLPPKQDSLVQVHDSVFSGRQVYCQAPRSTYKNNNNLTLEADNIISWATTTTTHKLLTMKEGTFYIPTYQ